jgi:hypothetical protein
VIEFLVDQNFNEHIVDGLTRRDAAIEFTYVRDVDLAEAPDPLVLEWAAIHGLILLTHDRTTMPPFANARVAAGLSMPGVFLANSRGAHTRLGGGGRMSDRQCCPRSTR